MVSQILSKYFSVFVDELIECGVDSVVLSPGSRSTPLAMLFYARKEIKCYMNIDERSAAFFALGLSKESQTPTVLVCTSGSAAANYYPAIVEANLARVPLIVITADRPPYMQGVGAAQTMYQKELYGRHVVFHEELALAKNDFDYQLLREKAAHFFLLSKNLKGVVHINAPVEEEVIPEILDEYYSVGRNQKICGPEVKIAFSAQESLLSHLQNKKVLIVVGFEDGANYLEELVHFCKNKAVGIIADPLSNIRKFAYNGIITTYDAFLDWTEEDLRADIIVRFGAFPLSKRFLNYCQKNKIPQIVIDSLSCHRNPLKTTILEVIANEKSVIEILSKYVEVDRTFVERWRKFEQIQKERFSRVETLREYEGWFVREILRSSAEAIFVSSSMSVRYLDYFYSEPFNKMVFCNRGVNGIDGTFSTALGVSTRKKGNTILITGDLAFIHDMNGMVLAKTHELPLVVVLFNNDGGGIFNYLPQSGTETFNYLFTTSHGLEFESIIRGYGHHYKALSQGENFLEVLNIALERKSVTVIEIKTDREKSVETTKKLIRGEM